MDGIRQIGKYIKNTNENIHYGFVKKAKKERTVIRARDIFDPTILFSVHFETNTQQNIVHMDLVFTEPPEM